ncbi:MAG: 4-hydroxythreonine-4-phosphate dehydrogenase PdxA [Verrucomicrobiales bacterium]|nr:4-hydroxythreonine-4-phosphate dehydrogenase PdxA [Verrucomicrobiales bacterium]
MLPIAISCGDHAGIGPEVALKAVGALTRHSPSARYVLIGDRALLETTSRRLAAAGMEMPEGSEAGDAEAPCRILDPRREALSATLRAGNAESAVAALDYLRRGALGCLNAEFSALVTAPVSKEAILRAGVEFVGQTEYLAALAGVSGVTMMLLGDDPGGRWLRVALATTHLPLRQVASALTRAGVERAIHHAAEACRKLRLPRARVAVAGLNPHAGEGGMLGEEEGTVIRPAVEMARAGGVEVEGPLAGDTVFREAIEGRYDAVVAMYHDQGLAPLKLVAFETGVNWSLGLPLIRTSPDHGTAFDIAGRGVANPASMISAMRLAAMLAGPK